MLIIIMCCFKKKNTIYTSVLYWSSFDLYFYLATTHSTDFWPLTFLLPSQLCNTPDFQDDPQLSSLVQGIQACDLE